MKNLLIITLLAITTTAFGQLNSFSVSADGGILFSEFAESRSGNAGTSVGFRFELPVGNFAISTGIEKTNFGRNYNFTEMPTVGSEDPGFPVIDVTRFDYTYLSVPLRIKYNYRMVYAQVGIKADVYQKIAVVNEGTMHDPYYLTKTNVDIEDIRKRNVSAEFALGFNYSPKHSNFGLYFEPTVTYLTKSIFENTTLDNRQVAYGLKIGAKYTFKNLGEKK